MFWIGLTLGLLIGGNVGVLVVACLKMSKN